jgi:enoyl-CoA hydratase
VTYATIRWEPDGAVATLRLHRPERMNAVIEEMYREIGTVLAAAASDPAIRAVVLTGCELRRDGSVRQAFCAGADLKAHGAGERNPEARRAYIELAHRTTLALWHFPKPVVAAINGPARGAGVELALCCDFVLMADGATLALPEVGLGTSVGGGVSWILPRLVGLARAKELIYSGRALDGPGAVAAGLVAASHPLPDLLPAARMLALELASVAPLSLAGAKRLLQRSWADSLEQALAQETETILRLMETEDWREGLRAFAEKRAPRFEGR